MSLAEQVAPIAGCEVVASRAVSGGDICAAWRVELADGRTVFAKQAPTGLAAMMAVEAAGLAWLAAGGGTVPDVIGHRGGLLVLSWARPEPPSADAARRFGQALALLHRSGAPAFGCAPPGVSGAGFIGSAAMEFAEDAEWPVFFAQRRIRPYLDAARAAGRLTSGQYDTVAEVCASIADLAGPQVPPARLHGDLWSGNILWSGGAGMLIDPAAHGGHPESDLAMLALFGAPHFAEILAGYQSVSALPDGWTDRVELHQLFPLLVHAQLFGGGYGASAAAAAARLLARRRR